MSEKSEGGEWSRAASGASQPSRAPQVHDVRCPVCHADDYHLLDPACGLLRCSYCRNTWIDERFIRLNETERYLREAARQPRVVVDNSTETDRQLMRAFTGLGGLAGQASSMAGRVLRGCGIAILGFTVVAILALVATFVLSR